MIYKEPELSTHLQDFKLAIKNFSIEYDKDLAPYEKDAINFVIEEIDNPKQVDAGKYKIPHQFLYDEMAIRGTIEEGLLKKDDVEIINAIADYKTYDGTLSQAEGEKLAELYQDSENYTFFHNVNYKGDKHPEEIPTICETICKDGLNLTSMGNEVGKIDYTTIGTRDKIGMIGLMPYWSQENGIIVLKIPKEKIDNNKPIIGSNNSDNLNPNNPGTILPEYVVGYLSEGSFKENPVPMEERKKYTYKFSETKTDNKEMI